MDNQTVTSGLAHAGMTSYAVPSVGGGAASANVKAVSSAPVVDTYVGGTAAFMTPKGTVDPQSLMFVLQLSNSDTGEVKAQYPSKKVVEQYHGAAVAIASSEQQRQDAPAAPVAASPSPSPSTSDTDAPSGAPSGVSKQEAVA